MSDNDRRHERVKQALVESDAAVRRSLASIDAIRGLLRASLSALRSSRLLLAADEGRPVVGDGGSSAHPAPAQTATAAGRPHPARPPVLEVDGHATAWLPGERIRVRRSARGDAAAAHDVVDTQAVQAADGSPPPRPPSAAHL